MGNRWKMRAAALAFLLAAAVGTPAAAPQAALAAKVAKADAIPIIVGGERSSLTAESIDGVPYLTLESAALLGAVVKKEKDGKTFTVTAGQKEVRFTVGNTTRYEDGSPKAGTEAPTTKDGKVFVPAAWLAEPLGLQIVKDRQSSNVYIFMQKNGSGGGSAASPAQGDEAERDGKPPQDQTGPKDPGAAGPDESGRPSGDAPQGQEDEGTSPGENEAEKPKGGDAEAGEEASGDRDEEHAEDGSRAPPAGLPEQGAAPPERSEKVLYSAPEDGLEDGKTALKKIVLDGNAVRIETNGNVVANVFSLSFPERIVIDLEGATVVRDEKGKAAGSLEPDSEHPYIAGIRYSLYTQDPLLVRIVLDMKKRMPFVSQVTESGAEVVITEREPVTVAIDAGHGGHDPGAISASGRYEKDVTLPIALKVYKLLQNEPFVRPLLIRSDDTYLSPAKRAAMANEAGADLFISIHANTAPAKSVKGTETYYWREDSLPFAELVHGELVKTIGSPDRMVRQAKFVVVKDTVMPAVLLELGFITNKEDETKLYDAKMQDKIAETIANAVKQYYDIS